MFDEESDKVFVSPWREMRRCAHLTVSISCDWAEGGFVLETEPTFSQPTAKKRADSQLSASCYVRWNALTDFTPRCRTNSRSEVETKRAKRPCERHLFLL